MTGPKPALTESTNFPASTSGHLHAGSFGNWVIEPNANRMPLTLAKLQPDRSLLVTQIFTAFT